MSPVHKTVPDVASSPSASPNSKRWSRNCRPLSIERSALEEAQRSGKRQAAPFRKKKQRSASPKKPGRKSGDEHGNHAHRTIPKPDQIDERYDVPLPHECPHCGGHHLTEHGVRQQYQTEMPRRPIVRQFDIHCGYCDECNKAVQKRHELQTSDALGAAASQLGPDLHAAGWWPTTRNWRGWGMFRERGSPR